MFPWFFWAIYFIPPQNKKRVRSLFCEWENHYLYKKPSYGDEQVNNKKMDGNPSTIVNATFWLPFSFFSSYLDYNHKTHPQSYFSSWHTGWWWSSKLWRRICVTVSVLFLSCLVKVPVLFWKSLTLFLLFQVTCSSSRVRCLIVFPDHWVFPPDPLGPSCVK